MSNFNLPSTFTVKGKIYGKVYHDIPGEVYLTFSPWDLVSGDYFVVSEVEFECPVDWAQVGDPRLAQIKAHRVKIDEIRAKMQSEVSEILERITKLEAIGWNGESLS